MQVTVRIKRPTAHDGRDWRVHRRSSPTAEVWNTAGSDLAERAQATGGALGHDRDLAPPLVPLCDETAATCPVDYGKRAGELIARGARSLRAALRQKKSAPPREPNGS